jgi:hypothetical protein
MLKTGTLRKVDQKQLEIFSNMVLEKGGRRRKQLLDDLKEREIRQLKEKALGRGQ